MPVPPVPAAAAPPAAGLWERIKNLLRRIFRGHAGRGGVQRQPAEEEEPLQAQEEEELMTKPDGSPSRQALAAIDSRRGGGQPLEDGVRSQADELAQGLKAKAFTTGKDIFFRGKDYDPQSSAGKELLGHELTHVVQQHRGLSEPAGRPGDRYEQEADRVGAVMFKGEAAQAGLALQRQEAPEEEEVQAQVAVEEQEIPEEEVQAQTEEEDKPFLLGEQLAGETRDYGPKWPEGQEPRPRSIIPGVAPAGYIPGVSDQPEVEKAAPGKEEEEVQSQEEEDEEVQAQEAPEEEELAP